MVSVGSGAFDCNAGVYLLEGVGVIVEFTIGGESREEFGESVQLVVDVGEDITVPENEWEVGWFGTGLEGGSGWVVEGADAV